MIQVSASGSSEARSIQSAVDASVGNQSAPALILIRDGVYEEQVRIKEGWMRIVGESAQRVILRSPIQISGGDVELENMQNGSGIINQNDLRDVPSLFLCGSREAMPAGPPPFQCYLYDETSPGGTAKGAAVQGMLGRIELFLRPGDFLALLCGPSEGEPGPAFCPGAGREFPLYLEMYRYAALENGARLFLILHRELPQAHKTALTAFARQAQVPLFQGGWPLQWKQKPQ